MFNWIKGLFAKLIGNNVEKDIDGALIKFGISKPKVVAWLAAALPMVGPISTSLGHPVVVPPQVYTFLTAVGLWAAGHDSNPTPTPPLP